MYLYPLFFLSHPLDLLGEIVVCQLGALFPDDNLPPLGEMWALTDSNRRPSACKADALNQLS